MLSHQLLTESRACAPKIKVQCFFNYCMYNRVSKGVQRQKKKTHQRVKRILPSSPSAQCYFSFVFTSRQLLNLLRRERGGNQKEHELCYSNKWKFCQMSRQFCPKLKIHLLFSYYFNGRNCVSSCCLLLCLFSIWHSLNLPWVKVMHLSRICNLIQHFCLNGKTDLFN